jgi:Cu-Zn family superoxide dismutase
MKLTRVAVLFPVLLLAACGGKQTPPPEPMAEEAPMPPPPPSEPEAAAAPEEPEAAPAPPPPKTMVVQLQAKTGSKLTGTATLTEAEGGVTVLLQVENVKPGDHGAHIHMNADCSAKDAKTAGDHFNPDKHEHGLTDKEQRHLGDLGNITVDKDGKGTLEITIAGANLTPGDPHSFIDRSVIVHEKKDDGKGKAGNAGGRIGCGEIKEGGSAAAPATEPKATAPKTSATTTKPADTTTTTKPTATK